MRGSISPVSYVKEASSGRPDIRVRWQERAQGLTREGGGGCLRCSGFCFQRRIAASLPATATAMMSTASGRTTHQVGRSGPPAPVLGSAAGACTGAAEAPAVLEPAAAEGLLAAEGVAVVGLGATEGGAEAAAADGDGAVDALGEALAEAAVEAAATVIVPFIEGWMVQM